MNKLEGYYTEMEVASMLDKKTSSLRSDASRRRGAPRTKIGKRVFYKKASFHKWLESHEVNFDNM